jgi:hypothetical protein
MTTNQPRRIRIWLVLLLVALFLAIWQGPFVWQSYRESRRRTEVINNLDKLDQAIKEYERSHPPTTGENGTGAILER